MKCGNLRRNCEITFRDGRTVVVEPYAIFTGESKRRLYMWYQLSSDPPEEKEGNTGWRTPEAAHVASAKLCDTPFTVRRDYDPFDRKRMPMVHYSIPTADGRQRWMDAPPPSDKSTLHAG